jgi:hypothetical protein
MISSSPIIPPSSPPPLPRVPTKRRREHTPMEMTGSSIPEPSSSTLRTGATLANLSAVPSSMEIQVLQSEASSISTPQGLTGNPRLDGIIAKAEAEIDTELDKEELELEREFRERRERLANTRKEAKQRLRQCATYRH